MNPDFFDFKTIREDYDTEFKSGEGTFYYLMGEYPIKGDIVRGIDSNDKNSEHLIADSEQLEQLQQIAQRVKDSKKSPKNLVRQAILDLCKIKGLALSEMAQLLNRKEDSLRNHYINPMCDRGILKRQYPNILNHPKQKYYTPKK